MGWATVVHEILYPFMAFTRFFRKYWVLAIITMHLCIGIFMGLYLFASIMIILNITAFLNKELDAVLNSLQLFTTRASGKIKQLHFPDLKFPLRVFKHIKN
ncbi:hypothetical protein GCM10007422_04010 [Pedobacter zeae]|nr:hypothetical protein GCM10007422_04010 [Pedobacter zeae]